MGYGNSIRILIEERDFDRLCEESEKRFPNYYILDYLDVKQKRVGKNRNHEKTQYIYFGWNYTKFDGEEEEWIKEFILNLCDHHFVRIGEGVTDIEEYYNLNYTTVDCIQIVRGFDENSA